MEWFDFGELQIVKSPPDGYQFVNTGGNILDVDQETAAVFLAIQNHTLDEAVELLKETGYNVPESSVREVISFLLAEKIIKADKKRPKSERFDTLQVLRNLREVEEGPIFVQDVCYTIGNACPLRCDYCFRKEFEYPSRVLVRQLKEVTRDLRRLGCLTVNISGGEPSIMSDVVCEVARDCAEAGLQNISVNTSAFKLDRQKLAEWKAAGVTFLNIKLDTMDRQLHDRMLGWDGAWEMAVRAIRDAVELDIQCRVNCTAYYEVIPTLDELITFCRKAGVYKLRINPYVPRPGELAAVHPETNKLIADKVRQYQMEGYNVYSPMNDYDEMPDQMVCSAGILKAVIETDGSVGACQFIGSWPKTAGNIFERSFYDIWTTGDWGYFRKNLATERIAEPCASCDWRKYCVSTCIAYAQALFGDGKITRAVECPFYGKDKDGTGRKFARVEARLKELAASA